MNEAERRTLWDHAHIDPSALLREIRRDSPKPLVTLETALWAAYEAGWNAGMASAENDEDDEDDEDDDDDERGAIDTSPGDDDDDDL